MDTYQELFEEKERLFEEQERLMAATDEGLRERQQLMAVVAAQRAEIDALRTLVGQLQTGGAG